MTRAITTAVTASVAQRMASFCSLGINMIPSVAIAGRKTIRDNRNSCDIALAVYFVYLFFSVPGSGWDGRSARLCLAARLARRSLANRGSQAEPGNQSIGPWCLMLGH